MATRLPLRDWRISSTCASSGFSLRGHRQAQISNRQIVGVCRAHPFRFRSEVGKITGHVQHAERFGGDGFEYGGRRARAHARVTACSIQCYDDNERRIRHRREAHERGVVLVRVPVRLDVENLRRSRFAAGGVAGNFGAAFRGAALREVVFFAAVLRAVVLRAPVLRAVVLRAVVIAIFESPKRLIANSEGRAIASPLTCLTLTEPIWFRNTD